MATTNPYHVDESKPWLQKAAGWPDEVPKNMEFPKKTLRQMFKESVAQWPDHHAAWFLGSFMSYRELDDKIDRLATALHKLGVKKGDVVSLLLPNSFQYLVCYYAIASIGAVASGINPTYKPMEILHQLKTVDAKTLIVLDALYEGQVAPIRDKSPVRTIIATNIVDLAGLSPIKKFLGKLLKKIPTGPVPAEIQTRQIMVWSGVDLDGQDVHALSQQLDGQRHRPQPAVDHGILALLDVGFLGVGRSGRGRRDGPGGQILAANLRAVKVHHHSAPVANRESQGLDPIGIVDRELAPKI